MHAVAPQSVDPGKFNKNGRLRAGTLGIRLGKEEEADPAGSRRPRFQIDGTQNRPQCLVNTSFFGRDQRFNRTAVAQEAQLPPPPRRLSKRRPSIYTVINTVSDRVTI